GGTGQSGSAREIQSHFCTACLLGDKQITATKIPCYRGSNYCSRCPWPSNVSDDTDGSPCCTSEFGGGSRTSQWTICSHSRKIDCRPAVPKPEQRQGERLLCRRHSGRDIDALVQDRRSQSHLAHIDAALQE